MAVKSDLAGASLMDSKVTGYVCGVNEGIVRSEKWHLVLSSESVFGMLELDTMNGLTLALSSLVSDQSPAGVMKRH